MVPPPATVFFVCKWGTKTAASKIRVPKCRNCLQNIPDEKLQELGISLADGQPSEEAQAPTQDPGGQGQQDDRAVQADAQGMGQHYQALL